MALVEEQRRNPVSDESGAPRNDYAQLCASLPLDLGPKWFTSGPRFCTTLKSPNQHCIRDRTYLPPLAPALPSGYSAYGGCRASIPFCSDYSQTTGFYGAIEMAPPKRTRPGDGRHREL